MSIDASTSAAAPDAAAESCGVRDAPPDCQQPADRIAREHAALLALALRTNAMPAVDVLLNEAGEAVAEVLEADAYGAGEVLDGAAEMAFTFGGVGPNGKGTKPLSRRGPLDPGASIAAYAIQAGAPIVASNVAQDPRFADLSVRQLGAVSALATPLRSGEEPLGVLAVFTKQAREFAAEDVRFIETVGHLLAASIARAKLEEESIRFRLFAEGVLDTVDSLVLKLDPQGNILDMNQACRRATGFTLAEVRNHPFVNVLAVAREVETIQGKLREAKRASTAAAAPGSPDGVLRFESQLLTKGGEHRRVAWSIKALQDRSGTTVCLLMTGTDRSDGSDDSGRGIASDRLKSPRKSPVASPPSPPTNAQSSSASARPAAAEAPDPSSLLLRRTSTGVAKDLRSSPRRTFRYQQRIAPIFGGKLPGLDDFFEVECEDISGGGIAFHLTRPPDFETLVIALGKPPQESYLSARIVRCTTIERDGGRRYLVGCSFTGKVSL